MQEKKVVNIGLFGLGTVGTGVVKLIEGHQEDLVKQTGNEIKIGKILIQDPDKDRNYKVDSNLLTTDPWEIIYNKDIDVIIEVMGNIYPTYEYLMAALEQRKHVVTANKDLMALHGAELLQQASKYQCDLYYEASVAGGIPIIRALVEGFASDRITKLVGIVNGTTNYILSKMSEEGLSFEEALRQAQELGYAESDPTSDVEGFDAARKMAILSNLSFHMDVNIQDVKVKGITQVTKEDIELGKQLGYVIKLLGIAQLKDEQLAISVQPTMINKNHPLAKVNGVFNAIYVYGEAVGETMFYGPGAGQLPTATAVVSDLVTVVKQMNLGVNGRGVVAPYRPKLMMSDELMTSRYFIRLKVSDRVGVLARITQYFAEEMVSIEEVLQLRLHEEKKAQLIIITHETSKAQLSRLLPKLESLEVVDAINSVYPVEGDEVE
ncbi:homoserine dehydrogenase [Tepidibacillus sp. LV47]|uniref:homoserine dehydrogenase n=1 Tax=Tepidibacillus sp. LV47 TaxID=3398228 RepID=UPI003AAD31C7